HRRAHGHGRPVLLSAPRPASRGRDLRAEEDRDMQRLASEKPAQLAGHKIAKIVQLDTGDGVKFFVDDGSWLLIRLSGTEPLVRVYAETRSEAELAPMLDAGVKMVKGSK